jgi:DNA-binding CsgD family transcriptional regulator
VKIALSGEPAAVAALIKRLQPRRSRHATRPVTALTTQKGTFAVLTPQGSTVAALVGQALTNQQIANRLNISPHTVNYHLRQIFGKLAIRSRVHLAILARAETEGHDGDSRE